MSKDRNYGDYKYSKLTSEGFCELFRQDKCTGSSRMLVFNVSDLLLTRSKKRKRIWIMASVVGVSVLALVIAAIVILTKSVEVQEQAAQTINLEDFLSYRYNPKSFNGTWVSGNKFLYSNDNRDVVLYDLSAGSSSVLLYSNESIILTAFDFKISANNQYLLVAHDYQKLYRHSYRARYTVINLSNGNHHPLQADSTLTGKDFFLVEWAPVGNALVYIYKNNIFYKSDPETDGIAITNSGETEFVFNGMPDWVYEEEIFSSNKALWFSDDGSKIAFARFNDAEVEAMVVPIYGVPGSLHFQYPRANFVKYPKAGTPNPTVSLYVYDIDTEETTQLSTTESLKSEDHILTAVTWATNSSVVAVWMNRVQNVAELVVYQNLSGSISAPTVIKTISESPGWVELFVPPKVSQTGAQLSLLLSKDEGDSSYRHLAVLNVQAGATEEFLTGGTHVVTEILGWNHQNNLIFYTATEPNDSTVQHLYSVSPSTKAITCLTCSLQSKNGASNCLYNNAEASTDSSHLVVTCNGPEVPHISILSIDGTEKLEWTTNDELKEVLSGKTLFEKKILEFEIADGFTGKVLLKLPPNMDKSGRTKYPMLVNVYGGPDTYQVTEKFSIDWGSYLAANRSIIYATIDGRGSGLRGNKLLFAGYKKLGTVEIVDQVNITKLIHQNVPYVDPSKTGIWGWSYGGYAAGMALANDTENVLKCGISVAPVTDWALYDSIYTERFMGLPRSTDNLQGYEEAQLLTKYAGLRGKDYFLIHGTFDDNVHYQQSMMWAKVLERNDILFRQLSYTDEDHSLSSVRPHLYHSLESFLNECFSIDS
ncbi:venom dipeptidyl peptidase 4-like isoform X1 [Euwallacea fornicatus]|uniref:venom dipeptidyl peptidase 4-like isoform X1 n=2 Tax=Euwallacea fornicatus TaxID=995702 RepID=UPI00338F22CA